MDRRTFLKGTSGAFAAALAGCSQNETDDVATELSGDWGAPKTDAERSLLPTWKPPEAVVEIFLLGGLNPWDTLYTVPDFGNPARGGPYSGQQLWTFMDGEDDLRTAFEMCGGEGRDLAQPFARDAAGQTVSLGPFSHPLRDRADLVSRLRLMVISHDKEPHQEAVPLMLTGQPRGSSRLAGLGAHIGRYWHDRGSLSGPASYVLFPDRESVAGLEAESMASAGQHPGAARPLFIRLAKDSQLSSQLSRPGAGGFLSQRDDALDFYARRYAAQMAMPSGPVRSSALTDYIGALKALRGAPNLAARFPADALAPAMAQQCGMSFPSDVSTMGIRLAAHLANDSETRYVGLVETGLVEAPCGAYDTHQFHIRSSKVSVPHFWRTLASHINRPGETDPTKLDLNRHLVLITTEMGRTPFPQSGSEGNLGLNHWPYGFVCAALGGFVAKPGIVGAIDESGRATSYVTPSEFRAGMLLGCGIWPFSQESFNVGNVRGAETELEAALRLRELLGLS